MLVKGDTFDVTTVTWVLDDSSFEHLLEAIAESSEVVMDLETTGLFEWATEGGRRNGGVGARIALASLTLPHPDDVGEPSTWVLPLSHPDSPWLGVWRTKMRQVAEAIRDNAKPFTNQNIKFDCRWTNAHTGVDLSPFIVWDPLMASRLIDENQPAKLKERAPDIFGVERWDDFDLSKPGEAERVPLMDLGLYAARDTYWTWKLAEYDRHQLFLNTGDEPEFEDEVEAARKGRLATWCSMPTIATLTAMEQRGIALDVGWVREAIRDHESKRDVLFEALANRYAPELTAEHASFAPTASWFLRWAALAVEAGDLRVAALTKTGKPQWSKGVLVRQQRDGMPVAGDLLDLRGHIKKLEFLHAWLDLVADDGRIYAHYNADATVTGRLSSSEPNMQQVTATLRPAFVPSPGYYLADLDYSQIELRVAAFVSRSKPMIEAFVNGWDLHRIIAARIVQQTENEVAKREGREPREIRPEDVLPYQRQQGKAANFGLLYGMGAYGFREYAETAYGVSFTVDEAVKTYHTYFETWDGLQQWHAKSFAKVHQTGKAVSPIGRVRHLPQIWDGNEKVVAYAERAAINAPVQGFASDIMQIAAASIEGRIPGVAPVAEARLVGTVHDSILVEVPIESWEETVERCKARMTGVGPVLERMGCHFDVPLVADAKVGTRWGLTDISEP